MKKFRFLTCIILITLFSSISAPAQAEAPKQQRVPDVQYVPTRQNVVGEMLKLANVTASDVVYDLGSGDGRIVITAAKDFGATGVGIEINPLMVREARENAETAGVKDKVKFIEGDIFEEDFGEATVVTMFLLPEINKKLRPKLLKQLKPGTRIVSHAFDMGKWKPEKTIMVEGRVLYLWTVPDKKR